MYQKHKVAMALLLLCCFLAVFFCGLYKFDNKYIAAPPYGQDGVLSISEADFSKKTPLYLINGWLLTDKNTNHQETYVGEFSNLQRGNLNKKPHGMASYELILRYDGASRIVAVDFPDLFSKYKIYVNGEELSRGTGSAHVLFHLQSGDTLLTVETLSSDGYYSGMYHPGALGDESTILYAERIKTIFYSICMFCTIILLSFTIQLCWSKEGDLPAFCLAWLCICFACYVSYYFVQLFSLPCTPLWYFLDDLSLYCLVFSLVRLTFAVTGLHNNKIAHISIITAIVLPIILLILHAIIPYWTHSIWLHEQIKNLYFLLVFICLLFVSILCVRWKCSEYPYILGGNLIFASWLLINTFQSKPFEPIYSLWQFEWCGILLVLCFASMMISRNKRMILENKQLTTHLESLVDQRTEELYCVIEERRAFFSDMAHDLKSPLFATKIFIDAIRTHSIGVDDELAYYLDQLDSKQTEMSKRVQSLNTLNTLDKINGKKERLSIQALLKEVYATYNAEAEVSAIHLIIRFPEQDSFVFMQQEKLLLVFENLIFNALHATSPGGSITIATKNTCNMIIITIEDTGYGISEAELPFIFKRFYIGEQNRALGSGLGLYIVKTILNEAGGTIKAFSQIGSGSVFTMEIPQCQ